MNNNDDVVIVSAFRTPIGNITLKYSYFSNSLIL